MNTVCLSENANRLLKDSLRSKGYYLVEIAATDAVYDAISSHGDIYVCEICGRLIVAPVQLPYIQERLERKGILFLPGSKDPDWRYPGNVRYNAALMGQILIHNLKHTDTAILELAKLNDLELIHVKQGYTKCNLVVVDRQSAITSDQGLASVLRKRGLDILAISHGHVRLESFPYGFLGGASGRVGDEIIFNGDLSVHPDFEAIREFIHKKGLQAVWFESYPLEDIGSIIEL